jgi:hypothetical protein
VAHLFEVGLKVPHSSLWVKGDEAQPTDRPSSLKTQPNTKLWGTTLYFRVSGITETCPPIISPRLSFCRDLIAIWDDVPRAPCVPIEGGILRLAGLGSNIHNELGAEVSD